MQQLPLSALAKMLLGLAVRSDNRTLSIPLRHVVFLRVCNKNLATKSDNAFAKSPRKKSILLGIPTSEKKSCWHLLGPRASLQTSRLVFITFMIYKLWQ